MVLYNHVVACHSIVHQTWKVPTACILFLGSVTCIPALFRFLYRPFIGNTRLQEDFLSFLRYAVRKYCQPTNSFTSYHFLAGIGRSFRPSLFFGGEDTLRSSRLMIEIYCAEFLSLLFRKLLIRGASFKEFSPKSSCFKEVLWRAVLYLNAQEEKLLPISAFVLHFFDLSCTS